MAEEGRFIERDHAELLGESQKNNRRSRGETDDRSKRVRREEFGVDWTKKSLCAGNLGELGEAERSGSLGVGLDGRESV